MIRKKGFDWNRNQEKYIKHLLSEYGAKRHMQQILAPDIDSYGDVLMPGSINWERSGKYMDMTRSMPNRFEVGFNPKPVNWLSLITDKYGIKAKLLKLDEHGTSYQPMTEDQKEAFKDNWVDLIPGEWRVLDGENTPLSQYGCYDHDLKIYVHEYQSTGDQQHEFKCIKCGETKLIGI